MQWMRRSLLDDLQSWSQEGAQGVVNGGAKTPQMTFAAMRNKGRYLYHRDLSTSLTCEFEAGYVIETIEKGCTETETP